MKELKVEQIAKISGGLSFLPVNFGITSSGLSSALDAAGIYANFGIMNYATPIVGMPTFGGISNIGGIGTGAREEDS
ncbi:MAG: hypothetical protein VB957_03385 [Pseudomonadales bacterium]|jgi:hypothetical protein